MGTREQLQLIDGGINLIIEKWSEKKETERGLQLFPRFPEIYIYFPHYGALLEAVKDIVGEVQ